MNVNDVKAKLEALKIETLRREQELLDGLTPTERVEVGEPIKQIKYLQSFQANGKKYIMRTSLTLSRFEVFQDLQISAAFSVDFENIFKNLRQSYDLLDEGKPASAAVKLYNLMSGVKDKMDGKIDPILSLCSLFICTEEEDVTKYDAELCQAKITDWKIEGIAAESFFSLAFILVDGYLTAYNEISNVISVRKMATETT